MYSGLGTDKKKPLRFLKKIQEQNDKASNFKVGRGLVYRSFCINGVRIESIEKKNASDKAILFLHGGAFLRGSDDFARKIMARFCNKTNAKVFMPDYSIMPIAFPKAIEEVDVVWDYLTSIYRPDNILLLGVGSGANLALGLSSRLALTKMFLPCAMVLIAPWIDMTVSGDSYYDKFYLDKALGNYVVDLPDLPDAIKMNFVYDYLNGVDRKDPRVSPLFGNLYGLPKTLIIVGDYSIIQSDAESLYKKLCECGVDVQYIVRDKQIGEYVLFYKTNRVAYKDMNTVIAFINSILNPPKAEEKSEEPQQVEETQQTEKVDTISDEEIGADSAETL